MYIKEFRERTKLSAKTATWLYENIFNHNDDKGYHRYTEEDVEWVLDHQIERFSEKHNIKLMEETDDEYYIEDNGNIYSYKRGFMEKRKPCLNQRNGYYYITLWGSGHHTTYRLARLVGKYFVPNPNNYDIINHLDGNKTNNHFSNLEWTTMSGNTKHAFDMGLAKNDKGDQDSQSMPVNFFDKNDKFVAYYGSIKEAGRLTGIGVSTIARLAKAPNKISRKYGIKVKYA